MKKVRDRAQGKNQVVVFQFVVMMLRAVKNGYSFGSKIDALHIAIKEVHAFQHFAKGIHDIGEIQIACRNFMQHWSEEKKVFSIDECYFGVWIAGERFFQLQCSIEASETASKN